MSYVPLELLTTFSTLCYLWGGCGDAAGLGLSKDSLVLWILVLWPTEGTGKRP
jgi:hypothetical protein